MPSPNKKQPALFRANFTPSLALFLCLFVSSSLAQINCSKRMIRTRDNVLCMEFDVQECNAINILEKPAASCAKGFHYTHDCLEYYGCTLPATALNDQDQTTQKNNLAKKTIWMAEIILLAVGLPLITMTLLCMAYGIFRLAKKKRAYRRQVDLEPFSQELEEVGETNQCDIHEEPTATTAETSSAESGMNVRDEFAPELM